jgi:hypothetical protein
VIAEAFSFLGNIDPLGWDREHYYKIWTRKKWYDAKIGTIRTEIGAHFRALMYAIPQQRYLLEEFKTKQRPPEREEWALSEDEIMILIEQIPDVRLLLFFVIGVLSGARKSALRNDKRPELSLTPEAIGTEEYTLRMFEEKVDKFVTRYFSKELIELLLRFVTDFKLKPKDLFFPYTSTHYNRLLKKVAEKANGIRKKVSTHIMKHTFIKQCALHGVPADVAEQQSGTELRTLKKWYGLVSRESQRKHMQGMHWEPEPFIEFARRVIAKATERYNFLIRKEV